MNKSLTAEKIGQAARFDPQLMIPAKPRLRRGLVHYVKEDRLVIEGGPKRQSLGGASATSLLPKMLELLDGERTHRELAEELETTEDVIFKVASLLWTTGVIEEGPPSEAIENEFTTELADFLSRVGDSTGANRAWEDAVDRLASPRMEVFGSSRLSDIVCGELESPMHVSRGEGAYPSETTTLVLLLVDEQTQDHRLLTEYCWRNSIPLFRLKVVGTKAILGPYVDPSFGPCLSCLTYQESSELKSLTEPAYALAGSLFARELMSFLSRASNVPLPMRWRRVDLQSLAASEQVGVSRPGCPMCSVAEGPLAAVVSTAAVYEASVSMPPKAFADLKAHQMHYKPSNVALQQKFQSWPVAEKFPLPEPDFDLLSENAEPQVNLSRTEKVTTAELSVLLKLMAGIRFITEERVQRWTAAGGNIGSVTAYLIIRDCPGLKAGCYAYVAEKHSLAFLNGLDDAIAQGPAVSLVLGGNYFKVASKYAAFALRIVLLDAGCAIATGHQVAKALDVGFRVQTQWDDEVLGRSLGLDLDLEPVTAVIAIGA